MIPIGKLFLALVVALSTAWPPFAVASVEIHSDCCCEVSPACGDSPGQTACGCPVCPPLKFPLAAVRQALGLPAVPMREEAWSRLDESADERRAAPPVPPPRVAA